MRSLLTQVLLLSSVFAAAQRIENVKATVSGDHVIITYDINGATPGTRFRTQLFSSHNNFSAPLGNATGDIGEVTAGPGKRIDWNARETLQTFSGDISFEVRGVPLVVPLSLTEPTAGASMKKGKTANIAWKGGASGQGVTIELLHDGSIAQQIGQTPNSGSYSWAVPKELDKGGGYQVRITSGAETATSQSFAIKNKTSPLLYIAPVVVVGGAVAALSGGGGGGGGGGNEPNNDLPLPPETP